MQDLLPAFSPGERRLSSLMFLVSTNCLFFGCLVPIYYDIALMFANPPGNNFKGDPFASGFHYMPRNISQMFSDFGVGTSRTFIGFMFGASLSMMASKYPWMLSNCCVEEAVWLPLARCVIAAIAVSVIVLVPVVFGPNEEYGYMINNLVHLFWACIL
ncbi:unnamed protein product, partial [Symbiodinium natans]